jgi:hypothetical protein
MAARTLPSLALLLLSATALHGCAALALPALGSAASGGANAVVKAGAASVSGGRAEQTFGVPLREAYAAVQATLSRLEFPAPTEEVTEEHVTLRTEGIEREVRVDLQPITPALTLIRIGVARGMLRQDATTATTLITLVADMIEPEPAALSGRRRAVSDRRGR